jgi:hypothetical protein
MDQEAHRKMLSGVLDLVNKEKNTYLKEIKSLRKELREKNAQIQKLKLVRFGPKENERS